MQTDNPYRGSRAEQIDRVMEGGSPYSAHEVWGLAERVRWNEVRLRAAMAAGGPTGSMEAALDYVKRHPARPKKPKD